MTLPASLSEVDSDWIERELRAEGHDIAILDAHLEPLAGFDGVMGQVMTVELTYGGPTDLAARFIAKCPKDDDMARLMNSVMMAYRRECGFYRDIAADVPVPVPECLLNRYDDETDRAVLFIERIEGRPGDIFAGADIDELAELLVLAAQMHGRFWLDDRLRSLGWIFDWTSAPWKLGADMVRHHWPALMSARPDLISPELRAAFERVYVDDIEGALATMDQRPWTLAHCDLQLDNVIFGSGGPVIIDWQSPMRSFPGMDIAWLLASSESPESVAEERTLLDRYRQALAAAGGPDWSDDDLLQDMCWALNFFAPGMAIPIDQQKDLPPGQDRQHDRLVVLLERAMRAAERWNYADRMR